jgi:3-dehydroquinate synthetase
LDEKKRIARICKRLNKVVDASDSEGFAEVHIVAISNDMNWMAQIIKQQREEIEKRNYAIQENCQLRRELLQAQEELERLRKVYHVTNLDWKKGHDRMIQEQIKKFTHSGTVSLKKPPYDDIDD